MMQFSVHRGEISPNLNHIFLFLLILFIEVSPNLHHIDLLFFVNG